jgi:hypothetical protein
MTLKPRVGVPTPITSPFGKVIVKLVIQKKPLPVIRSGLFRIQGAVTRLSCSTVASFCVRIFSNVPLLWRNWAMATA